MNNIFAFAIGAAIGSLVTWKIVKTKYEQIAQEEIDSVKETFSRRSRNEAVEEESDAEEPAIMHTASAKPDLFEYAKKLNNMGYTDYIETKDEKGETVRVKKPYTISPEEFGEVEGYEQVSLLYYADEVLTDEDDHPIEEIEDMVGPYALDSFGEYEDDAVYVRNEIHMTDYEILRDERNFADLGKSTHADE